MQAPPQPQEHQQQRTTAFRVVVVVVVVFVVAAVTSPEKECADGLLVCVAVKEYSNTHKAACLTDGERCTVLNDDTADAAAAAATSLTYTCRVATL
jgi:hypothetical protein